MKKLTYIILMSSSILMASCNTAVPSVDTVNQVNHDKKVISYDSRTIMQGLFFGQGPVAALFPEIWQQPEVKAMFDGLTPEDRVRSEEAIALIMNVVADKHSEFIESFSKDIQSGNPIRISAALDSAAVKVQEAANSIVATSSEKDLSVGSPDCIALTVALAAAVWNVAALYSYGAVAVAAIAVAATVAVKASIYFWSGPTTGSSLEKDIWISRIATRLNSN